MKYNFLDISKFEAITLSEGTIFLGPSDSKQSIGFLRLLPHSALAKHNRPVAEWLVQVEGESTIVLYEEDIEIQKVQLKRGNTLLISANQFHQHINISNEESLTSWRFNGDIINIIDAIKNQNENH